MNTVVAENWNIENAAHQGLIFAGEVLHARIKPQRHVFRIEMLFVCVDIDRLEELSKSCSIFGFNRFRPFSKDE